MQGMVYPVLVQQLLPKIGFVRIAIRMDIMENADSHYIPSGLDCAVSRLSQSRTFVSCHRLHAAQTSSAEVWTVRRLERVQRTNVCFTGRRSLSRILVGVLDPILCMYFWQRAAHKGLQVHPTAFSVWCRRPQDACLDSNNHHYCRERCRSAIPVDRAAIC